MPLDQRVIEILVCPLTRRALAPMGGEALRRLNDRIGRGELRNSAGEMLDEPLEGALVREGGDRAYPVRDGIPVLLGEEGISLSRAGKKENARGRRGSPGRSR